MPKNKNKEKLKKLLKTLPSHESDVYTGWAPGCDAMAGMKEADEQQWWTDSVRYKTWAEFRKHFGNADDLNLVVHFYFAAATEDCPDCSLGYTPEGQELYDTFYDEWQYELVQEEVDALIAAGRVPEGTTVDNVRERRQPFGHDAIDHHILIHARAKRKGFKATCPTCDGEAEVYTDTKNLRLTLWIIHPRKGASRGILIEKVPLTKLDEVKAFLRGSWEIHKKHFGWTEDAA